MKKLLLIFLISKLLNEVDNLKPIICYINSNLNNEVGKKEGVIFVINNMTYVDGIIDTKREVLFKKKILDENNATYEVGCGPWLYKKFYIICEFDEAIPKGNYSFNFNSFEDIFNYSGYEIHLQSYKNVSFLIQKLDLNKVDIYSGPQIINVTDDKDNYELKYNIKSYNGEQIFIIIVLNIIPISIIPLECKRNNDELICQIKKAFLECYGGILKSNSLIYMDKDGFLGGLFNLIAEYQINFHVQKINVYINITKLITKSFDKNSFIVYETNITSIPEVNALLPNNVTFFENEEDIGFCFFRKEDNSPLLLLCSPKNEGVYSLKEIKNEIRITDINYKYNFIISPVTNNEKATVSNIDSNEPLILSIYPNILDFNKKDLIQIDIFFIFLMGGEYTLDRFSYNEDAEYLKCEINLKDEYFYKIRCNVSNNNFKGNNNKNYYILYENPISKNKSILYYSSPVKVILPTNNTNNNPNNAKNNTKNNNTSVYIVIIIAIVLIVIIIAIFIFIFIYKNKNHDLKEEVLNTFFKDKD